MTSNSKKIPWTHQLISIKSHDAPIIGTTSHSHQLHLSKLETACNSFCSSNSPDSINYVKHRTINEPLIYKTPQSCNVSIAFQFLFALL